MALDKLLDVMIYVMIGFFLIVTLYLGFKYDKAVDLCDSRGGILIDSSNGYVCMDRKVLIKP